ncbi:MAG: hypothetical protein ACU0AU_05005 [Cognatishimia activa]
MTNSKDDNLPVRFRERLEEAFKDSPFTSYRQLSVASDLSVSRIHRLLSGQHDNSKDGPGFFSVIRICENLGITPDFLAGISEKWKNATPGQTMEAITLIDSLTKSFDRPTTKELARLYMRSGQRIEAFEQYMDYFDVYEALDFESRRVKIRSVGDKSLSTIRMGKSSEVILQDAYDNASPEFQEKIFAGHERGWNSGFLCEVDSINERVPNRPVHVKIDFLRVAMRVTDAEGSETLLIFCELLPQ